MRLLIPAVLLLCACPPPPAGADGGVDGGLVEADAGVDAGTGDAGSDAGVAGVALMTRLAGLWVGPARMTPLGDFPIMYMDFRPVGPGFLFAQADLDVADNLRFGISIETYGGADVLAYRNGGLFQGVLRDSRTKLVESDDAAGRYRFCSVPQGCAYIDATFTFSGAADLVFDSKVRGTQHVLWTAQRRESRPVPAPFPATPGSMGDGTAPWPAMASVQTTVRWVSPLTQAGTVWVLLTTTPCAPAFTCVASRSLRVEAAAGATSATLTLLAVHAGDYRLTAVVDRTRTFGTRLAPASGDSLAVDQAVTVPASGQVNPDVLAAYTLP
ncbi:MAG: hypothetical protein Q8L48_27505 [Archangium sp.]|nr:hypothetical protein [Archangium sp.]